MSTTNPYIAGVLQRCGRLARVVPLGFCSWLLTACSPAPEQPPSLPAEAAEEENENRPSASPTDPFARSRHQMVEQLRELGIQDDRVLGAVERVPRHRFVPEEDRRSAYADTPLPIGHGQTISQPCVVALMTELVAPRPNERALDVGTGSGYQAAILGELCKEVYGIEIVEPLAEKAKGTLGALGYDNVQVRHGDGYRGWPEFAPFDVIVVAAAPNHVPPSLIEQLAPGGRMVIPVGEYWQQLTLITKDVAGNVSRREVAPVAFVPMTGEARE